MLTRPEIRQRFLAVLGAAVADDPEDMVLLMADLDPDDLRILVGAFASRLATLFPDRDKARQDLTDRVLLAAIEAEER